ncbi:hypothetical protein BCR34DRAFT_309658 [Clohesyomyces aquaticus]|uniref:Uncharacterized protein n=1 Tax=Clohesyomyces aquaticus TaxID=1231657 RepID=A0A1Y1ZQ81_9PLEO|nr:hypothetical protein BCR34DRAFT_309658 [Clohesyomyces aquaticus]
MSKLVTKPALSSCGDPRCSGLGMHEPGRRALWTMELSPVWATATHTPSSPLLASLPGLAARPVLPIGHERPFASEIYPIIEVHSPIQGLGHRASLTTLLSPMSWTHGTIWRYRRKPRPQTDPVIHFLPSSLSLGGAAGHAVARAGKLAFTETHHSRPGFLPPYPTEGTYWIACNEHSPPLRPSDGPTGRVNLTSGAGAMDPNVMLNNSQQALSVSALHSHRTIVSTLQVSSHSIMQDEHCNGNRF